MNESENLNFFFANSVDEAITPNKEFPDGRVVLFWNTTTTVCERSQ